MPFHCGFHGADSPTAGGNFDFGLSWSFGARSRQTSILYNGIDNFKDFVRL
jgi:hypothetical protein